MSFFSAFPQKKANRWLSSVRNLLFLIRVLVDLPGGLKGFGSKMNKEEVRKPKKHGDMTTSRPDKQIETALGIEVTVIYFFLSFLETDVWMKSFLKTFYRVFNQTS